MSLIPFLLDLADEIGELNRGIDDNFGFGVYPHELHHRSCRSASNGNGGAAGGGVGAASDSVCWLPRHRHHPYDNIRKKLGKVGAAVEKTGGSDEESAKLSGFQASINVHQFKPKELLVKTIGHTVIVEGKHEEREDDHGVITRHFVRKYQLPKGYDPKEVTSTLSSDGILTVKAPNPSKSIEGCERVIEIQQTGPAHLSVKDNNTSTADIAAATAENNEKKAEVVATAVAATATKPTQCENGDKPEEIAAAN